MDATRTSAGRAALIASGAVLGLVAIAPAADAKVFYPVRDKVLVVGKQVRLEVPGCATGAGGGCIASYPGPVRIFLLRENVPIPLLPPQETAEAPRPSRPLGRLADSGRLRFVPHAAGRFRLVALLTVGSGDDLRTLRMAVSPVFPVHPRGWRPSAPG
jgi:hypothetical protein